MGYIIAIIIIIGIVGAILGWIKDRVVDLFGWIGEHIKGILAVVALVGISHQFGPGVAGVILICGAIVYGIVKLIKTWTANKNERELRACLETSCLRCGYMDLSKWQAVLPGFAGRVYPKSTSFSGIVTEFARKVEKIYITDDEQLSWLTPAVHYLVEEGMADIGQLSRVPSDGLAYTHVTVNEKLIHDAMEKLCISKQDNGKAIIERIPIEDEAARKEFGIREGASIPEYYKTAYKISDSMMSRRKSATAFAMESEELSLDDL